MESKYYLLVLFLFSISQTLFAQTNTYILNDTICCSNTFGEKEIDIDQDGIEEIKIVGTILTDVGYYYVEALSSNIKVSSIRDEGEIFQTFSSEGEIAIGGVGCLWSNYTTGDPNKFIGIQQIEGIDTLWSYIEIEFSEEVPNDNSCWDSRIIVLNSVENTIPNQNIIAGETLTSLLENDLDSEYRIYPSPTSQYVNLPIEFLTGAFQFFDINGKEIQSGKLENTILDISNLNSGIYFFRIEKQRNVFLRKILKK